MQILINLSRWLFMLLSRLLWGTADSSLEPEGRRTYAGELEKVHNSYVITSAYNLFKYHIKNDEEKVLVLDYARKVIEATKDGKDFKFGECIVGIRDGCYVLVEKAPD